MNKHAISSDEKLNGTLKEEVATVRGGMVGQAEKIELPSRFEVTPHEQLPAMIITDKETNRSIEVSLFAYREVRKALAGLFCQL